MRIAASLEAAPLFVAVVRHGLAVRAIAMNVEASAGGQSRAGADNREAECSRPSGQDRACDVFSNEVLVSVGCIIRDLTPR